MLRKTVLFSALCLAAFPLFAEEADFAGLITDANAHLHALVGINTAQPDGNEIEAARYIYKVFNSVNLDWDIYINDETRANISAVIKGSDSKLPPLILLSHLDTVAAGAEWTKPPFKTTVEDGKIYGLGTTDDKNYTAAYLAVVERLKKNNITPKRDIIFLATSDEEAGGEKGLKWLASKGFLNKYKGAYALNEGGSVILMPEKKVFFVEAAAKAYMDVKMTAYGSAGHSATIEENAVYILTEALKTVQTMSLENRLNPLTRKFFTGLSTLQDDPDAQTTIALLLSPDKFLSEQAAKIMEENPFFKSQLQDSVTPTLLAMGQGSNVSSSEASAVLNCRLLPDTNPDEFFKRLQALFTDNSNIFLEITEKPVFPFPLQSKTDDALSQAIIKTVSDIENDTEVLFGMSPASNDSEILRRYGIITYGLGTGIGSLESAGAHSHIPDEHITQDEFDSQVKFTWLLIKNFAVE